MNASPEQVAATAAKRDETLAQYKNSDANISDFMIEKERVENYLEVIVITMFSRSAHFSPAWAACWKCKRRVTPRANDETKSSALLPSIGAHQSMTKAIRRPQITAGALVENGVSGHPGVARLLEHQSVGAMQRERAENSQRYQCNLHSQDAEGGVLPRAHREQKRSGDDS